MDAYAAKPLGFLFFSTEMGHTGHGGGSMEPKSKKRVWPPQAVAEELEQPIPEEVYPVLDTDLARDNVENDLPEADLEDL